MSTPWYILGAGAIGSIFASALHRAGLPVVLLQRDSRSLPQQRSLRIDTGNTTQRFTLPVSGNTQSMPIQKLLVCTKAYDVYPALTQIAHRLGGNSHIVIMANGMGFMASVTKALPKLNFTLATTTEGAYRIEKNHYCHAGEGQTRLGQAGLNSPPAWFKEDWSRIDRASVWETDIERVLWEKLAVNCAINPLTALERCHNGELSSRHKLATDVNHLCKEISQVSAALGYSAIAENIHSRVTQVIADTALNQSSMLQDVLAGRRTENDYISGYLLGISTRLKIPTPCNRAVFERIQQIDRASA